MIREAVTEDMMSLLRLCTELHDNPYPLMTNELKALWDSMIKNEDYHIIVAEEEGKILSSCVLVIILNLTHGQRPYALIENVITGSSYRNKGLASACLSYAKKIAEKNHCYKIMLLTGSKEEKTIKFYQKAGFNNRDKTGFVQWLS